MMRRTLLRGRDARRARAGAALAPRLRVGRQQFQPRSGAGPALRTVGSPAGVHALLSLGLRRKSASISTRAGGCRARGGIRASRTSDAPDRIDGNSSTTRR